MAISWVSIANGGSTNTFTAATSAITLTSGKVYFFAVKNNRDAASATPTATGWSLVTTIDSAPQTPAERCTVFIRDGDGSTSVHTATFSGEAQNNIVFAVDEATGADAAATVVVQSGRLGGRGLTASASLVTFGDAVNHHTYFATGNNWGSATSALGNLTKLAENAAVGGALATFTHSSQNTAPNVSIAATANWGAVAIEVGDAAAAGGASTTTEPTIHPHTVRPHQVVL